MGTTTHALIARHTCLMDRTNAETLPRGWQAILDLLLRDVAEELSAHPAITLEIRHVRETFGSLRVSIDAGEGEAAEAALRAVKPLIAAAEVKTARTCQVCGAMGQRRTTDRVATLCDAHYRHPMPDDQDSRSGLNSTWLPDADIDTDAITAPADGMNKRQRDTPATLDSGSQRPARRGSFRLYHLRAVADALGRPADLIEGAFMPARTETEHESRLADILDRGDAGTWRSLANPSPTCLSCLDALDAAAPHMGEVTALVRRHVQAALAIGLHVQLPPLMLLGEPGLGKSWYLTRLGKALGVPVRTYPMSASSLSEGLQGAHPSWRNAGPGLIARTLLQEDVANPLILVDEIDKAASGSWNADPYRPLYALLEPAGSKTFRDEYLQFEMDASAVSWVVAGNEMAPLPEPIRDRLTVIEVPSLSRMHLAAVAANIYAEANEANAAYFGPSLDPELLDLLLTLNPRGIRKAVQDAMVRAASHGRQKVGVEDVVLREHSSRQFGFHNSFKP